MSGIMNVLASGQKFFAERLWNPNDPLLRVGRAARSALGQLAEINLQNLFVLSGIPLARRLHAPTTSITLTALSLLWFNRAHGQPTNFERVVTSSNDNAFASVFIPNMTIVGGSTDGFNSTEGVDGLLMAVKDGLPLWSYRIGGPETDNFYALARTPTHLIGAGSTTTVNDGSGDGIVFQADPGDGHLNWIQRLTDDNTVDLRAIGVTSDGKVCAAGLRRSLSDGKTDACIICMEENTGASIWGRTWGGPRNEMVDCLATTQDGLWIGGYFNDTIPFIAKWLNDGTFVRALLIQGPTLGRIYALGTDVNGGVFATGWIAAPFLLPGSNTFLIKLFENGTLAWAFTTQVMTQDDGRALLITPETIWVAGYGGDFSTNGDDDALFSGWSPDNGMLKAASGLGKGELDYVYAMTKTTNGIGAVGITGNTTNNIWVAHLSPNAEIPDCSFSRNVSITPFNLNSFLNISESLVVDQNWTGVQIFNWSTVNVISFTPFFTEECPNIPGASTASSSNANTKDSPSLESTSQTIFGVALAVGVFGLIAGVATAGSYLMRRRKPNIVELRSMTSSSTLLPIQSTDSSSSVQSV